MTHATVMFSAGEASGDQHAANLFIELKKQRPDIKGIGMGSSRMKAAGIDVQFDSAAIAVIGVVEVLKHYAEIRRALRLMQQLLLQHRPDLLVCVDYKEFNFKLARFAKQHDIKVLFYVSPQVWAWRPGRVKQYGQVIDMMAVIFPFETAYYQAENVPVRYVGHPSIDKVHPELSKEQAMMRFGLRRDRLVLGLLPGSRVNEVKRLLPVMLAASTLLRNDLPELQIILPQASSISDELLQSCLRQYELPVTVIKNQVYDVLQCCDAVMTSSGTATLEIALMQIPMLIAYKLSAMTYWLGRLLVRIPYIGLPNIILGRKAICEFIQHEATPLALAAEARRILTDSTYNRQMRSDLAVVKQRLGDGGGSRNMAALVLEMLDTNQ